jgi:hypothetical protein
MRFPNSAIRSDIDAAMDAIMLALEERPSVKGHRSSSG